MKLIFGSIFALILLISGLGAWYVFKAPDEPATLAVSAGPRGGDAYTLMSEIAEVLERRSETVRLDVRESLNSSVNISRLHAGQVELATVESNTPAYNKIELVADLFADYFLLITHKQNRIYSVADLPGHKVALPEEGSSGSRSFWSVIDHYRIPPESFRSHSREREKAVEKFLTKQVDALFIVASLRDPFLLAFFEEARQRGIGIRFVPVEQSHAMALKRPFLEPVTIVRGAFEGGGPLPLKDIPTVSLHRLLVARAETPEDAINELVRVIFENRLDLLTRMPLSSSIRGPRADSEASLPFHPGAQSYYDRDQPSFLQENAEPLALVITIFAMTISALLALRNSLSARAKNRADVYNTRLLEISAAARQAESIDELHGMRKELAEVLETIVHALDNDKVTEEGFQSFSFLWGSVRDQVNERRLELTGNGHHPVTKEAALEQAKRDAAC